jgi:hypothetical protein
MRKQLFYSLVLAMSAGPAFGAEEIVKAFTAATLDEIIEIVNVPQKRYLIQGKNVPGGPLMKSGIYTWCQVDIDDSSKIAPGDKFIVLNATAALANGFFNNDDESGRYILAGVKAGKLVIVSLYCEPAATQDLTREQLSLTLANHFKFTGVKMDDRQQKLMVKAIEDFFRQGNWTLGTEEYIERITGKKVSSLDFLPKVKK